MFLLLCSCHYLQCLLLTDIYIGNMRQHLSFNLQLNTYNDHWLKIDCRLKFLFNVKCHFFWSYVHDAERNPEGRDASWKIMKFQIKRDQNQTEPKYMPPSGSTRRQRGLELDRRHYGWPHPERSGRPRRRGEGRGRNDHHQPHGRRRRRQRKVKVGQQVHREHRGL